MSQPLSQFRHGPLSVTLFRNSSIRDGVTTQFLSAVSGRSYKNAAGEWEVSNSLTTHQIPTMIRLLQAAYDKMLGLDDATSDDLREALGGAKKPGRTPRRNGHAAATGTADGAGATEENGPPATRNPS